MAIDGLNHPRSYQKGPCPTSKDLTSAGQAEGFHYVESCQCVIANSPSFAFFRRNLVSAARLLLPLFLPAHAQEGSGIASDGAGNRPSSLSFFTIGLNLIVERIQNSPSPVRQPTKNIQLCGDNFRQN